MRGPVAASLLLILTAGAEPARGGSPASERVSQASVTFAPLAGAWNGHWTSETGARGAAEVIVTRTSNPTTVLGQFTFVHGGQSWTARREGSIVDGAARFELPEAGAIVLRLADDHRITGEWRASGGAMPATDGALELTRVR